MAQQRKNRKGQGQGMGPGSPPMIKAAENEAMALLLRKEGDTYQQIADKLGLSIGGAYTAFQRGLQRTVQEPADEYRKVEFERLQAMIRVVWPLVKKGDFEAIKTAIKIQERVAKLLGLDAATKHEVDARMTYGEFIAGTFTEADRIKPRKLDTEEPLALPPPEEPTPAAEPEDQEESA